MFNLAVLYAQIKAKVHPPIAVALGSPRQAAELVSLCPTGEVVCFQMDLHQAARLQQELEQSSLSAKVETMPDLWDLPEQFQTVLFPVAMHGERELKLDLLEQSYQILRPHGVLISLTEYQNDQLLPKAHKKIFGKCSEMPASRDGGVFWSHRDRDKPRRRHEMSFHARIGDHPSHSFVSQPGVFSYGCMDDGARALLEIAEINPGNAILDLGCGVGTNGVLASDRAGTDSPITFVDSNLRAIRLADRNARENGLTNFNCLASATMEGLPDAAFDVVLANPPYYAASAIAKLFAERSRPLMKAGGRLFLVTKQVEIIAPFMVEIFGDVDAYENRGYTVIEATVGGAAP
jgi:16S rRNA (guanine1207-N2)-methyltransferase